MQRVGKALVRPRILWGALLVVPLNFLFGLRTQLGAGGEPPDSTRLYPYVAAAAVSAVLSLVLPSRLHRAAAKKAKLDVEDAADAADDAATYRDRASRIRVFSDPRDALKKAVSTYYVPLFVGLSLGYFVAVAGAIVGFIGFGMPFALPFFVTSALLFAFHFPRPRRVLAPLEEAHGARLVFPPEEQSSGRL
jgi:hypothetical protein